MKRQAKFFQASLLAMMTCICHGQDLRNSFQDYFSQIRAGRRPSMAKAISSNDSAVFSLEILQPFLKDSSDAVRAKAYEATFLICSRSEDVDVRRHGVEILTSGYSGKQDENAAEAIAFLTHFRKDDFTLSAKDSLRKYVRSSGNLHVDGLMKLAGYLGLRDLIPDIRPWSLAGNPTPLRWAALLSLARLGDPSAITDIMKRVRKLTVNDDVVYEVFPDLLYTRQSEPIAYAIEALQSDDRNCRSPDAEREKPIPCGYRIIELLAPVIDGYPLELDETGDIKTNDYTEALKTVRAWFNSGKAYKILTDKY